MAKNPEQVAQTKKNLRDAFWSLYKEKRIDKISIKEITDKAGYNRGTFYLYNKDVYDILDQIEEELLNSLDDVSESMIKFVMGSEGYLEDYNKFLEYFRVNSEYISVLLGENGDAYFSSKYKDMLKIHIRKHINDKAVEYSEETIDFSLEFFISGLLGLILYYLSKHKEPDFNVLTKITRNIIVQSGISNLLK